MTEVKAEVLLIGEPPAEGGLPAAPPEGQRPGLSLAARFRLLKGALEYLYGDRVAVAYVPHAALKDTELGRQAPPLPAVAVNGRIILRGDLRLQTIVGWLTEMGVDPESYEGRWSK